MSLHHIKGARGTQFSSSPLALAVTYDCDFCARRSTHRFSHRTVVPSRKHETPIRSCVCVCVFVCNNVQFSLPALHVFSRQPSFDQSTTQWRSSSANASWRKRVHLQPLPAEAQRTDGELRRFALLSIRSFPSLTLYTSHRVWNRLRTVSSAALQESSVLPQRPPSQLVKGR